MNNIDLTNLGGFPFEQDTLKFMQDAYGDLFSAIARLFGNKTIISGVVVAGGSVSDGWICYNGEILKFVGGAAGAGVVIVETTAPAVFEDGSTKQVFKTRVATIGTPGTFDFADLVRVDTLLSLVTEFAKHKAHISYTGSFSIGDVGSGGSINDTILTVTIPDQGGTNYIVTGSLVGHNADANFDNDVMYIISHKTATTFQIALREINPIVQNLSFEFAIINPN